MSKKVKRLFEQFQPDNYNLTVAPDRIAKKAAGSVTITGRKTGRPSQRLTFHQKGLKILSATIVRHDKKGEQSFEVERIHCQKSFNEVRLHAKEMLYPGVYTVTMEFESRVQDSMHGIYLCNYELDGKKKQLISTQFESHSAREAFPSIDEPEAKATFDLTLITPEGEAVLANTPVKEQKKYAGQLVRWSASKDNQHTSSPAYQLTTFETTPKMSSYLLAFVTGDMQSKSAVTKHGVTASVWATKVHRPEALDFGLEVAVRSLEFLTDYYGVDYPLKKCDFVAVPDFAVGAMENWGAITFRESCLLSDPASASQSGRERIALVVSHELAHMWFGDLVTMKWWDDLWLNESFANVMEYVAVDALFPEWHVWDDFTANEGLSAIRRDCIPGVQSVMVEVRHPDEIASLFDPSIVYAKGGRLLNMLKNYLGEATFRRGLKLYFDKNAFGNTTGNDLWQALSEASGKDVAAFMNPWLQRSGFPLIEISQLGSKAEIRQSHFLLDEKQADAARVWPVPLLASDKALPEVFDYAEGSFELESVNFVQLDKGAVGHYIVRYSEPDHLKALAEQAKTKKLSTAERLMLLHDSSLLARAGRQPFADSLKLLEYYDTEDGEPVWGIMALLVGESRLFVDVDEKLEPAIKKFTGKLVETQYQRLGWDEITDEPSGDTKLRAMIIGLGVYAEHPEILPVALEKFEKYKSDPSSVTGEIRATIFGAAVRMQTEGAFDYLVKLHDKTNDAQLKEDIAGALTTTKSADEAAKLLDRLKDPAKVRAQDVDHWLVFLLRNRHTRQISWDWFRDNWSWIEELFAEDKTYDIFPRYVASAFSSQKYLDEYKAFFEPKLDQPALARNIAMGIEEISARAAWLARDLAGVQTYFKS
jgi:aminopeptidase N